MRRSLKKALWLITIAAAVAVMSAAFVGQHAKGGAQAAVAGDDPTPTPVGSCANTACNTACWADGTHHNHGTFAKQTVRTPVGCTGTGGCVTEACQ